MTKNKKWIYIILSGLVCANVIAFYCVYDLHSRKFLEVDFFDVGQGDSIFVEAPNGNQVLIDGGPDNKVIDKLAKEMPFYDRTIDLVILTHTDQDHLFGLLEVLKRYKVKNILWADFDKKGAQIDEWRKLVKEEKANAISANIGKKIIIQNNPLIAFEILGPLNYTNSNDSSIVSRLNFNKASFLFTGDATSKIDYQLIGKNIKADVLKVAHHGSDDATSLDFLNAVSPQIAVISVGKDNKYGHPSTGVLENLEKSGIQVQRTDQSGDIKIISDGKQIKINK